MITAYSNQKDVKSMEKYVHLIDEYQTDSDYIKLLIAQAKIVSLVVSDKIDEASKALDEVLTQKSKFLKAFLPSFLIMSFSLRLKQREFAECFSILEKYKKTTGFVVRVNYMYMKSMLNHLVKGKPLYTYESEFEHHPELLHQLEVIKALSRGDIDLAKKYWAILSKHNPKVYLQDFKFNGDFCLFSFGLEKYAGYVNDTSFNPIELNSIESPLDRLSFIFENRIRPIAKDLLIKLIWNDDVSQSSSARLRKLVSRYNQKSPVKLVSHQETYRLEK